jgi:hypothetical protein
MHEQSPGVGLVKEGDLHRKLEHLFAERGYSDPAVAARFLEDVRTHSALLLDRGGRQYSFIHLTFQEYLAAVAVAQKAQQGAGAVADALAKHVGEAPLGCLGSWGLDTAAGGGYHPPSTMSREEMPIFSRSFEMRLRRTSDR